MINIGVIGCGEWGPNHIRIFSASNSSRVLMGCDLDDRRLKVMQRLYPDVIFTKSYKDVLKNERINAVCIATPASTHYKITKEALLEGKDVLCEKPLALKTNQHKELIEIARSKRRILMTGYVFLFNKGIGKIKEYIIKKRLGTIQYIHSERTNLGPFRYDINVLWDLAPHDISIFNYLMDSIPLQVSACGAKYLSKDREDLAFITLTYPNKVVVNIRVSWLDPKKVREIIVVGTKKMLIWNDLDNRRPIRIYNKHVERERRPYNTFGEFQLLVKEGEMTIPKIKVTEPLKMQNSYFLECIINRRQPKWVDGKSALDVTRVLIAAQKSINKEGAPIKIN